MLLKKISAALQLSWQFLCMMVKSGFDTLLLIVKLQLKLKKSLQDNYISVEMPNISETGLVILGCLISLTPGTTLLDINSQTNRLLLHVLDIQQSDNAIRDIKQKFEPYIRTLFSK